MQYCGHQTIHVTVTIYYNHRVRVHGHATWRGETLGHDDVLDNALYLTRLTLFHRRYTAGYRPQHLATEESSWCSKRHRSYSLMGRRKEWLSVQTNRPCALILLNICCRILKWHVSMTQYAASLSFGFLSRCTVSGSAKAQPDLATLPSTLYTSVLIKVLGCLHSRFPKYLH